MLILYREVIVVTNNIRETNSSHHADLQEISLQKKGGGEDWENSRRENGWEGRWKRVSSLGCPIDAWNFPKKLLKILYKAARKLLQKIQKVALKKKILQL